MDHADGVDDAVELFIKPEHLDAEEARLLSRYWNRNLLIMRVLLAIWAVAGLGCGVLFAEELNAVFLGGYPLGFWFAQQGAIIIFVLIVLVYAALLNRLDAQHHRERDELHRRREQGKPR